MQQQAEKGGGDGGAEAVSIYTLASVCRLRVCSIREGDRGSRGASPHVGIQFYTNLLLFLPKLARSLGNFHSFCSRHTRFSLSLSHNDYFFVFFSKRLLGSCIFYASKSNNLRISYGHTYFTSLPLPLSPSLSLASCVMNFPRLPLANWPRQLATARCATN